MRQLAVNDEVQRVKVKEIIATKRPVAVTIKAAQTIAELSRLLAEHRIGAAVVSSDGVTVDGVISERDFAYGVAKYPHGVQSQPVSTLMTKAVISCSPQDEIGVVASTMLPRNIRHVPVVEDGRLVGMVSIRDVLKQHADDLQRKTAMLLTQAGEDHGVPQDR